MIFSIKGLMKLLRWVVFFKSTMVFLQKTGRPATRLLLQHCLAAGLCCPGGEVVARLYIKTDFGWEGAP